MTNHQNASRAETVEESTPELVRLAMHDAAKLLRAEGRLLAAEIDGNLRGQLSAMIVLLVAAGLAITGLAFAACGNCGLSRPARRWPGDFLRHRVSSKPCHRVGCFPDGPKTAFHSCLCPHTVSAQPQQDEPEGWGEELWISLTGSRRKRTGEALLWQGRRRVSRTGLHRSSWPMRRWDVSAQPLTVRETCFSHCAALSR